MSHWRANGKLLLTGEYAILDGAKGLAVPTKLGQSLDVASTQMNSTQLNWESRTNQGEKWIDARIKLDDLASSTMAKGDQALLDRLIQVLQAGQELRPDLFAHLAGNRARFTLDFPRDFGLGSSSTLLHLLGKWWKVDPFALLEKTFGGSGYDLACAATDAPVIYWRSSKGTPKWTVEKNWHPDWLKQTFFVHLNQKQNSREGIRRYENRTKSPDFLTAVSTLTDQLRAAETLNRARQIVDQHEALIGKAVALTPVKEMLFGDFSGSIKSLGAWGGDFVWVLPKAGASSTRQYFTNRGYGTIFNWTEMVHHHKASTN